MNNKTFPKDFNYAELAPIRSKYFVIKTQTSSEVSTYNLWEIHNEKKYPSDFGYDYIEINEPLFSEFYSALKDEGLNPRGLSMSPQFPVVLLFPSDYLISPPFEREEEKIIYLFATHFCSDNKWYRSLYKSDVKDNIDDGNITTDELEYDFQEQLKKLGEVRNHSLAETEHDYLIKGEPDISGKEYYSSHTIESVSIKFKGIHSRGRRLKSPIYIENKTEQLEGHIFDIILKDFFLAVEESEYENYEEYLRARMLGLRKPTDLNES